MNHPRVFFFYFLDTFQILQLFNVQGLELGKTVNKRNLFFVFFPIIAVKYFQSKLTFQIEAI